MALIKHPSDVSIMHDRTTGRHQPKREKEGIVMRKVIFAVVLAVFIFGLFSLFNAPFSTQADAQSLTCWCCYKDGVAQITTAICKEKGGMCFNTQAEALRRYQQQQPHCYCCYKDGVAQITQANCKERGGMCFRTNDEAVNRCQKIWCCLKGEVVETRLLVCQQNSGLPGRTRDEAVKYCQRPPECWCCIGNRVIPTTRFECTKGSGVCFGPNKEDAVKRCQPTGSRPGSTQKPK